MTWTSHPMGTPGETREERDERHRRQLATNLAHLAKGHETGWWDEHGIPAPWPEDFFDHNSGWRPGASPTTNPPKPGEQPF